MTLVPAFAADYPGAIVTPANIDNVYSPAGHGGVPNQPRAFVIHTPEERADNIEVTPTWFQGYHPAQRGSTHYYLDNDGDVYQCVPESWGAIANGFNPGNPQRLAYPAWAGSFSLNWQTLSVEVEGYAHNIQDTLNPTQFDALVRLVRHRCQAHGIPITRDRIIGHYELATDRTDPGPGFPWARFMSALRGGSDVPEQHNRLAKWGDTPGGWRGREIKGVIVVQARKDLDLPADAKAVDIDLRVTPAPNTSSYVSIEGAPGQFCDVLDSAKRRDIITVPIALDGTIRFLCAGTLRVEEFGSIRYWRG